MKKLSVLVIVMLLSVFTMAFTSSATCTIAKNDEIIEVNMQFPIFYGMKNIPTQKYINTMFFNHASEFMQSIYDMAEQGFEDSKKYDFPFMQYAAWSQYDLHFLNERFMSLTMNYYQFTGGAHGLTVKTAYNIDLSTGKNLELRSIFSDDYDYSSVILKEVNMQMKKAEEGTFFSDSIERIENEQNFYLTEEGIVMFFQQYEIGPYCIGIPEFFISFDLLRQGLKI